MAQKASKHNAILTAVQTAIRALITAADLSTIVSASVVVRKFPIGLDVKSSPLTGELQSPAILICPLGRKYGDGDNARNEVGYRVGIALLDVDNQNLTSDMEWHLSALETIEDEFVPRGLPGIDVHHCECDVALSYNFAQWLGNWAAGSTVLTFYHWKAYGN